MTATIVKGIVAYTAAEAHDYRRKDFSRFVFQFTAPTTGARADTIRVPRIPAQMKAQPLGGMLRAWLGEHLSTKLRPNGRIVYEDLDDEVWVKLGH